MTDHQYNYEDDDLEAQNPEPNVPSDEEETISLIPKEGDELLISLVKNYPHLYDKQSKNDKDQLMKNNSWKEIAEIMNMAGKLPLNYIFVQIISCLFYFLVSECQNRWIRLREKYAREKKKITCIPSGAEGGYKIQWPYFSELKFLEKHITSRR